MRWTKDVPRFYRSQVSYGSQEGLLTASLARLSLSSENTGSSRAVLLCHLFLQMNPLVFPSLYIREWGPSNENPSSCCVETRWGRTTFLSPHCIASHLTGFLWTAAKSHPLRGTCREAKDKVKVLFLFWVAFGRFCFPSFVLKEVVWGKKESRNVKKKKQQHKAEQN